MHRSQWLFWSTIRRVVYYLFTSGSYWIPSRRTWSTKLFRRGSRWSSQTNEVLRAWFFVWIIALLVLLGSARGVVHFLHLIDCNSHRSSNSKQRKTVAGLKKKYMKLNPWDRLRWASSCFKARLKNEWRSPGEDLHKVQGPMASPEFTRTDTKDLQIMTFVAKNGSFSAVSKQILQVNMRLKALAEIYTMHYFALLLESFALLCNPNFLCRN